MLELFNQSYGSAVYLGRQVLTLGYPLGTLSVKETTGTISGTEVIEQLAVSHRQTGRAAPSAVVARDRHEH